MKLNSRVMFVIGILLLIGLSIAVFVAVNTLQENRQLQAAGFEVEYTSTEQAKQEFKQSGRLDNSDITLDDYELPASITIKAKNAEENELAKSLINQQEYNLTTSLHSYPVITYLLPW